MTEVFIIFILIGIALIWLTLLTYFLLQDRTFLRRIFPKAGDKSTEDTISLRVQFDEILEKLERFAERERITAKHLQELRKEGLDFMQIVETMRYNPYGDVGGDQSFSFLLADAKKNGILFTSLHGRSGTRLYIKPITEGKSELELSQEEKKLLDRIR